jgi:hypothetical protein
MKVPLANDMWLIFEDSDWLFKFLINAILSNQGSLQKLKNIQNYKVITSGACLPTISKKLHPLLYPNSSKYTN